MDKQDVYQYSGHKFFSRAFTTVFSGSNFWYFLLACLIALIPIIGPFWAFGYFIRRAQKIAWGINRESTSEDFDFVPCIKIGFATSLLYLVVFFLIKLLGDAFNGNGASFFWVIIEFLIQVVLLSIADIFALHYAIYNNVSAIFTSRPFKEIKQGKDSFINMNIAVIFIVIIFAFVNAFIFLSVIAKVGIDTLYFTRIVSDPNTTLATAQYILANIGTFFFFILALIASTLAVKALHINAVGLWLMGSNVSEWNAYNDSSLPRPLNEGERPHLTVTEEEVMAEGKMEDGDITSAKEEVIETIHAPGAEEVIEETKNPLDDIKENSEDKSDDK